MNGQGEDRYSKRAWRERLLAARRLVPTAQRATEATALAAAIGSLPGDPVCCYLPVRTEPGSLAMIDALAGRQVLLPVVTGAAPLDWAIYDGTESLADGPYGLVEPAGPRLGPAAIARAQLILVPALAVDRHGIRLGRGGGHYDRSLPLALPGTRLVAIVRDDELVAELPAEPHDVRMTAALTPSHGYQPLGN